MKRAIIPPPGFHFPHGANLEEWTIVRADRQFHLMPDITACECTKKTNELNWNETGKAFWCERHKCWKPQHHLDLCRTKQGYFDKWERGEMGAQQPPGKTVPDPTAANRQKRRRGGPGTQLSKMFERPGRIIARIAEMVPAKRLGEISDCLLGKTEGCNCPKHALMMDNWGPEKCRERMERIVGWLVESAKLCEIDLAPWLARILVKRAIRKAEKENHD